MLYGIISFFNKVLLAKANSNYDINYFANHIPDLFILNICQGGSLGLEICIGKRKSFLYTEHWKLRSLSNIFFQSESYLCKVKSPTHHPTFVKYGSQVRPQILSLSRDLGEQKWQITITISVKYWKYEKMVADKFLSCILVLVYLDN